MITHVAAHVTESVCANDYAGMENDSVTNRYAVFEKYVGMNHAIAANCNVVANFCASTDLRPWPYRRILADAHESANKDFQRDVRAGCNDSRGVNFRLTLLWRVKDFCNQAERQLGILYFDPARRIHIGGFRHNHTRRFGRAGRLKKFLIFDIRDFAVGR